MARVDLNCDLGEGAGHDAELMSLITSANIACGAHAGDEGTMHATVQLAIKHGVAIGAHPGFDDRENFGRKELSLSPSEVKALVLRQIQDLQSMVRSSGGILRHVKPHGALYNMAARDRQLAGAIAQAVYEADPRLVLFGLAGSELLLAGAECGLITASEVFADRTYQSDGSLTPRSEPQALIEGRDRSLAQVLRMVQEGNVLAVDGAEVRVRADTVCLHGDGHDAVSLARYLVTGLRAMGIELKSPTA